MSCLLRHDAPWRDDTRIGTIGHGNVLAAFAEAAGTTFVTESTSIEARCPSVAVLGRR
jgi:hypothetical protein